MDHTCPGCKIKIYGKYDVPNLEPVQINGASEPLFVKKINDFTMSEHNPRINKDKAEIDVYINNRKQIDKGY